MPLRVGQLVTTQVNEQWQSTKYWDDVNHEWIDIKAGSACLIISIDPHKVLFTHSGRVCTIHNCYNGDDGVPVWCAKL
jgi:hypothetical protein